MTTDTMSGTTPTMMSGGAVRVAVPVRREPDWSVVDPSLVLNQDVISVLLASVREQCRADARVLRCVLEVARRDPQAPFTVVAYSKQGMHRYAGAEVGAALSIGARAAGGRIDLAWTVIEKYPVLYEALCGGRLDVSRARQFCDGLT